MTNKLHEALSALMDDEADELELRRLLKGMESGASQDTVEDTEEFSAVSQAQELKAKWQRYHVLSASCKQEIHTSPACNLLDRINAELENELIPVAEPAIDKAHTRPGKGIFQFLGQGAIAASVALAVLFTADMVLVADNDAGNGISSGSSAEMAANDTLLPGLTGDLNPSTETRVAVQTALDAEEMSRLQQVVSQELEETLETREVPATFSLDPTP